MTSRGPASNTPTPARAPGKHRRKVGLSFFLSLFFKKMHQAFLGEANGYKVGITHPLLGICHPKALCVRKRV